MDEVLSEGYHTTETGYASYSAARRQELSNTIESALHDLGEDYEFVEDAIQDLRSEGAPVDRFLDEFERPYLMLEEMLTHG